jgi:hypothetical protein
MSNASNTRDAFTSILSPQLCSNPDAFLMLIRDGIYQSPLPLTAARRFPMRSITVGKMVLLRSQHECSSARFKDLEKLEELLLFVERNVSSNLSPNNKSTFETVKQTFVPILSSVSSNLLPPTPSSTELIPLINPSDDSSEFERSSLTVTPTNLPGPTLLQRASLGSTQSVRLIHESFAELHDTDDRVLGTAFCDKAKGSYGNGRVVREVILPDNTTFTLLDLAILIVVIHLYAPIYSLFENQCYWFVKILLDAIVAIARADCVDDDNDSDLNDEPYQRPLNRPLHPSSYLPALCGTWNGILVSQVKEGVLATVLSEFSKRRAEEMAEVYFLPMIITVY